MSTSTASLAVRSSPQDSLLPRLRTYFADHPGRVLSSGLGVIWCLDAGLQFQSFMYSPGFIDQIRAVAVGQPEWAHAVILWGASVAGRDLGVWNSIFAAIQVLIGVGLLCRATVRPALVLSVAWALFVWVFGEGFSMLLVSSQASPLAGAPGAVIYVLVGLLAWPGQQPGGALGVRGARTMWAVLWLLMAWLWLGAASAEPGAIRDTINAAPSGMSWLSSLQDGFAAVARGNGVGISLVLAAASVVIGIGVALNRRARPLLVLAIGLNLVYWVVGQGFGGIFTGGATDPNVAPLFMLMAYGLWCLIPLPSASADLNLGSAP